MQLRRDRFEPWTHEEVADRIADAWDAVRRLPPVRGPAAERSGWPSVVHDWQHAYGYGEARVKLPPPSPLAIDHMEECFSWFRLFESRDEARLVWLVCGLRVSKSKAARTIGIHRDTVRVRIFAALSRVVHHLNKTINQRHAS